MDISQNKVYKNAIPDNTEQEKLSNSNCSLNLDEQKNNITDPIYQPSYTANVYEYTKDNIQILILQIQASILQQITLIFLHAALK